MGGALAPVPSGGDVTGFAKSFREMGNNSIRNNLTSIVVTRNGLYAFRVSNPTTLSTASDFFNNQAQKEKFEEDFEKEVRDKARIFTRDSCNGNCTDAEYDELFDFVVEDYFIKFINRTGLGIGIYKGELNPQTGNYDWIKITN